MIFPTAGIETAPWIPIATAFGISFFTSMGGVSGAFLLLPFQMSFLGYTHPSVSATNQFYNLVAIPAGVFRYYREGRLVWPLAAVVTAGTLPGVFMGAYIRVVYLPAPGRFKLFAALVLLYIGLKLVRDLVRKKTGAGNNSTAEKRFHQMAARGSSESVPAVRVICFNWKRLAYGFYEETFDVSFWGVFSLSLVVGVVGGIYGIGGGAIIAPFFVSFFNLPVYTVAGAALLGTFATSLAGVSFYWAMAPFYPHMSVAPDWKLGLLFGLGGMAGMYLGARCQKHVPAFAIKGMLSAIIILTAVKYVMDFLGC